MSEPSAYIVSYNDYLRFKLCTEDNDTKCLAITTLVEVGSNFWLRRSLFGPSKKALIIRRNSPWIKYSRILAFNSSDPICLLQSYVSVCCTVVLVNMLVCLPGGSSHINNTFHICIHEYCSVVLIDMITCSTSPKVGEKIFVELVVVINSVG
jgi:hypothetical protein